MKIQRRDLKNLSYNFFQFTHHTGNARDSVVVNTYNIPYSVLCCVLDVGANPGVIKCGKPFPDKYINMERILEDITTEM